MAPDSLPARQLQLAPAFVHGKGPAFSRRAVFAVVFVVIDVFLLVVVVVAVIVVVGDIGYDNQVPGTYVPGTHLASFAVQVGLMVLVAP